MNDILVIGSANVDFSVSVARLPQRGETILGSPLKQCYGGKGANQALAAARLGGRVALAACLGRDDFGEGYVEFLRGEGIDTAPVRLVDGAATGSALIFVERMGQNMIVVSPAANAALSPEEVDGLEAAIAAAKIVLLQMEIPAPSVLRAIELANKAGTPVMLNPSPMPEDFPWGKPHIDYLVLNYVEAEAIVGRACGTQRELTGVADQLIGLNVDHVIVTRGEESTLVDTRDDIMFVPAISVSAVDTVGAGDTFTGALAVALCERMDLLSSIRFANCAGALAVTRHGAQPSIPSREEVEQCLHSNREPVAE